MSLDDPAWKGRRKRLSRRLGRDLRTQLPLVSIVFCFALSATAIVATEWIPSGLETPPPVSAARESSSECDPAARAGTDLAPAARPTSFPGESANGAENASTSRSRAARPRR